MVLLSEFENEKDVAICVEKIMKAVTAPLKLPGQELHLTLSIGIGIYPGDGDDPESLIRSADTAMYRAKAEGHGKYQFFRKEMNVVSPEQSLRA